MSTIRIKLTGQLITDEKPTVLLVSSDANLIIELAEEYIQVYPEMVLTAEWGYFKPEVSLAKKQAIARVFNSLNSPLSNLFSCLI